MPQDVERYLYFTVALLKDSLALDALWQDALNYHMIDQPGKLIAMRLTEYYELKASGALSPVASMPTTTSQPASNGVTLEQAPISRSFAIEDLEELHNTHNGNNNFYVSNEVPLATSSDAAHNAEAAAEYWTVL